MRTKGLPNYSWISLVRVSAGDTMGDAPRADWSLPDGREEHYIETLLDLVDELMVLRQRREGRLALWKAWGRGRDGGDYQADLHPSPRHDRVTVDEAAAASGVTKREVLAHVRAFKPHPTLPPPVRMSVVHVEGIEDGHVMVSREDIESLTGI
jgi:hypothetical protein